MRRAVTLLSAASIFLMGAAASAATAEPEAGFALKCVGDERAGDLRAVTLEVAKVRGLIGTKGNWDWFAALVNKSGGSIGPLQSSQMAEASLYAEATLIRRGSLVAALMVHDGSSGIADYKGSKEANEVKRFLVASVSPTSHPDDGSHDHKGDDRVLLDIAKRLQAVKVSMGPFYADTAAKYFIRAHAYRDPVGVEASRQLLCSQVLDAEVARAIGLAAYYVTTGAKPAGVRK